jgi:hypothetical protein
MLTPLLNYTQQKLEDDKGIPDTAYGTSFINMHLKLYKEHREA